MLLDGLLEAVLRGTREFVDLLAVLEVHESGNTSHTLDVGKGIELINIHMDEDYIRVLCSHGLEDGGEHAARWTPRGRKVGNDELLWGLHELVVLSGSVNVVDRHY